jgi:hypothetical protein
MVGQPYTIPSIDPGRAKSGIGGKFSAIRTELFPCTAPCMLAVRVVTGVEASSLSAPGVGVNCWHGVARVEVRARLGCTSTRDVICESPDETERRRGPKWTLRLL